MTERENMLSGLLYDPSDPELSSFWAHWESGRSCIPMSNLTMAAIPTWETDVM